MFSVFPNQPQPQPRAPKIRGEREIEIRFYIDTNHLEHSGRTDRVERAFALYVQYIHVSVSEKDRTLFLGLPYCSVLTGMGGVVAPSPRLDLAANQMWYKVLG